MSDSSGGPSGCQLMLLLVVIAIIIGAATSYMNSQTPLAKSQRALREAEEKAQTMCREAGCPRECYNAGMC